MKYKIWDKVNNEYLDLTKYCVNGLGDVMTVNGMVLLNKDDFEIHMEIFVVVGKSGFGDERNELVTTDKSEALSKTPNDFTFCSSLMVETWKDGKKIEEISV